MSTITYFERKCRLWPTVILESLVPRVCGGSKILQIQKIQKMLFSFELPLSTFKRLQMLSNELSEIWAGKLAIISGGFGPQFMIEGLLIAQRSLHIRGDPALSYTYYSSRVNQAAGTVGACWQICWGRFKERDIGFLVGGAGVYIQYHWLLSWLESLCAYILSLSLILHHMYLIRRPLYICLTFDSWPSWLQSTDPLGPLFKAVTRVWCQLILNTILWVQ